MSLRSIQGGVPPQLGVAEYVWVGGNGNFTGDFHTKTRVVQVFPDDGNGQVPQIERWTASMGETGERVILSPCYYLPDPLRPQPSFIALCEVKDSQDTPHPCNTRARLRELVTKRVKGRLLTEWGFRQPFMLESQVSTRDELRAVEAFLAACIDAGVMIHSVSTCPGQPVWEFKTGRRWAEDPKLGQDYPLAACEHLWLARYLLGRCALDQGVELLQVGTGSVFLSTAVMREDDQALHEGARRIHEVLGGTVITRQGYIEYGGLPPNFDPYTVGAHLLETLTRGTP